MDKGELFKSEFTVAPVEDGGFILFRRHTPGQVDTRFAFTNVTDLKSFIDANYAQQSREEEAR